MKYPENIIDLSKLTIDYMGLIFYSKSPRYVDGLDPETLDILPRDIEKVGVFVNANIGYITECVEKYKLNLVQLHGSESVDFCNEINKSIHTIKAFSISEVSDFEKTKEYEGKCDYFLFDTKTPQYGGSGLKFDWNMLNSYKGNTPFFLSGGISAEDTELIKKVRHPLLYALDLNSKFEIEAGLKNTVLLKRFIKDLKDEQN